ncbi:SDR family NAD(P)-dependent oxidoreductase [Variovorax sp. DT-64]|uniref:SDR family NAD(P)-dependent oxidoreductase n=1 Tax=Variovorax sp. DT-64 TaxID=3396160 RepID=UPI003F1A2E4A
MNTDKDILTLDDKVALVTGGGQGVGRGIARLLAAHGASVVVNDYHLERAKSVAAEITEQGGQATAVQGDVTDFASVGRFFEEATASFGRVDVLVNNAGNAGVTTGANKPFWESGPEDWKRFTSVNLDGVMNCCRLAIPGMIERNSGRVITIISDAGRTGEARGLEAYSAAKAGAAGFMRGLARGVGRYGITANTVAISAVATPAIEARLKDEEYMKKVLSNYVIRRVGQPEDIAAMVLFLASSASGWITGQTYPVNGGFSFNL